MNWRKADANNLERERESPRMEIESERWREEVRAGPEQRNQKLGRRRERERLRIRLGSSKPGCEHPLEKSSSAES